MADMTLDEYEEFSKKYLKNLPRHNQLFKTDIDLPDGEYDGIRGGYQVEINGKFYDTNMGVRGRNIPVKVEIKNKNGIILDR